MTGLEYFMLAVNTASHTAESYIYLSLKIREDSMKKGNKRACVYHMKYHDRA